MNVIVGKNSFISKQLMKRNNYQFTSSDILEVDKNTMYLDLNFPEVFDYTVFNENTYIIFLAAISSPDECNKNYERSYKINVTGTKYFIKQAIKQKSKILFFSSDVIYGNRTEEVDENSKTDPFGNYAKMKEEVEKYFLDEVNFKVFRLSYVLSFEDKYLSYLRKYVESNSIADVFHPFYRKIIYIDDLLTAIESILLHWQVFKNQKFNICGEKQISRKKIADLYNSFICGELNYNIIEPDEVFWQARPKEINITSQYINKLLGYKPLSIDLAIKKIVKEEN